MGRVFVGTSGWSYKHWRGNFYPNELPAKEWFSHYCRFFDTVEINNSFYRLPTPETVNDWRQKTPANFVFAVKANRFVTHMKKLRDPAKSLVMTLYNSAGLGEKLGPMLFQMPPFLKVNPALLEAFLEALPSGMRCVFEFRNPTWYVHDVFELLRRFNCAFCLHDLDGHMTPFELTADFVYVRLHGPGNKYQGSYSDDELRNWAARCRTWSDEKDVFVYFDNDENAYAAFNALKLKEFIG